MVRYAISDGACFGGDSIKRHAGLLADARRWADEGIDFVQLREKTLAAGDLLALAEAMSRLFHEGCSPTRLLINGRADVAIAARADGVHLTANPEELSPGQVRRLFAATGARPPVVSVSCHTLEDVRKAWAGGADLILFGPVFEKAVGGEQIHEGLGIEELQRACEAARATPVLALGGVTLLNTPLCLQAGAAGVAGIRLFR